MPPIRLGKATIGEPHRRGSTGGIEMENMEYIIVGLVLSFAARGIYLLLAPVILLQKLFDTNIGHAET